ncbi:MAG TPA: hypothetical protein VGE16_17300 [Albitalea sp.]
MEKDLIQVLAEDHAVLGWLTGRLRETTATRQSLLFNEFARALGAHQMVVDQVVIPALKSCGWRGLSSDVLAGHMGLKRSLAELLTLRPGSASFDAALGTLLLDTSLQTGREHDKLLPLLHQLLDAEQLVMLAYDAEVRLAQLVGDGSRLDDIDIAQPVDELLAEAHVVLASLPGTATPRDKLPS